jgi:hypothetical protein
MSSNRLIYDKCAYATEIKESTSSLDYFMFKGKYQNCTQCPVGEFPNNIEFPILTDVESELYGLTRNGSLCPAQKYNPDIPFKYAEYSPPRMCQSIYNITPSNLEKPLTNMIDEKKIDLNINKFCN